MSGKLQNKIALITGGNSGIGLSTAQRFASEGAQVFITGRRQPELDAAIKLIGGNAIGIQADVSKLADLERTYNVIKQSAGRIDVLFANAGTGEFRPLGSITESHFDRIFQVNVKGTLFTVQTILPLMPDGASIVLNASITSITGPAAFSVYSASKAAVRSFARGWSVDLKERAIRVNVVSPGVVITPAYKSVLKMSDEQIEAFAASTKTTTPLGRPGTSDEIAKAVVFLASDDSSYITGIELYVDGGMTQV